MISRFFGLSLYIAAFLGLVFGGLLSAADTSEGRLFPKSARVSL